ncbi:MAG: hypothetical protein ACRED5_22200 [Propylenella sp.]
MKSANLLATLIVCALVYPSGSVFAQAVDLRSVALVRQDFSDCSNADVSASDTSLVGGTVAVERRPDGSGRVRVSLGAQPNTTYHFFLKCVRLLGDFTTDTDGFGSGDFRFQAGETGDIFAFDVYPEGAPSGNKYQSVQVNLREPPPVVEVPPHIEYVRQSGDSVSFFYEGMPAGSEVAVVNSTFGSPTVVSTYPLSPLSTVFSDITISGEGVYYLLARGQANKHYIAQSIQFYLP